MMSVLARKFQQAMLAGWFGDCERLVQLTVLAIDGGKARLGFVPDAAVPLQRSEVLARMGAGVLANEPRRIP